MEPDASTSDVAMVPDGSPKENMKASVPGTPLQYVFNSPDPIIMVSPPEYVTVGYTPGYLGEVITPDGVVVHGTGYAYPA